METYQTQKEDRDMLFMLHLSQLLNLVTGFGGLIAPIIIWSMKKDDVINMDEQGKQVINFQITLLLAAIVSGILCLVLIGFILLPIIVVINIVFPIIQANNAKNGKPVSYPCIKFI